MKNKSEIKERMQKGGITGASFATIDSQGEIAKYPEGFIADQNLQLQVEKDTPFQCASLSKPVFAYLVLKLIEANKTKSATAGLGEFNTPFDLDTPLYTVFRDKKNTILAGDDNSFLKKFKRQDGYGLIKMANEPSLQDLENYKKNQYIFTNEALYYFDCITKKIENIACEEGKKSKSLMDMLDIEVDRLASNEDLALITSYTGRTHQDDQEIAKQLTAKMVLSHTTGLPIVGNEPYQFQFAPGKHYAYSGPGIKSLQEAIETLTSSQEKKTNIETLAQEHVFGENALKMPKSTFGADEPAAAKSLKTTAEEYAKFIQAWINDDKLNYAFESIKPADSMINDYFTNPKAVGRLVEDIKIEDSNRNRVAWGLGIGLVKNEQDQIIGIYHTGDMGNETEAWRAGFGASIDPKSKRCIEASVYLTKSPNGHMLADQVLPKALKPALDYFFPTYGFARTPEELYGTNYHGMNPKLLKPELQEAAYKTTAPIQPIPSVENSSQLSKTEENSTEPVGSTAKMFQLMPPRPKPTLNVDKSQEQEKSSNKITQKGDETTVDEEQGVRRFNPAPTPY